LCETAKLIHGTSHFTGARVSQGETVEVDTLIRICDFLRVPFEEMLEIEERPRELIMKIRKLVSFEPELGEVLKKSADRIIYNSVNMKILTEVSTFTAFRLEHQKNKDSKKHSKIY